MAAPTVVNDTATTTLYQPVTVDVKDNDTAGDDAKADGVITFKATGQPAGVVVESSTRLSHPDQGVWTVDADENVVFSPYATFTGAAAAVIYVYTESGGTDEGTVTVTVATPDDLSADRLTHDNVRKEDRFTGIGKAVDVVLDAQWDAGDAVDPASLGLNRIHSVQIIIEAEGNVKAPVAPSNIASGAHVRFIGA